MSTDGRGEAEKEGSQGRKRGRKGERGNTTADERGLKRMSKTRVNEVMGHRAKTLFIVYSEIMRSLRFKIVPVIKEVFVEAYRYCWIGC
jgi:hypothetical protein